ncbi:probable ATP-dependent RNA helicase DDX46 [Galendromus occidentalis]|uniref:Probable ATP-dependent RNA helicase DDX46 n=1 Tax=Galendromus occidentalis TaxID=34638 RepID=A0AAJ7SFN0_9ACAR|nr:probable ATP-dependent RNA helicase DDX46 [Galendromus occidentalis]
MARSRSRSKERRRASRSPRRSKSRERRVRSRSRSKERRDARRDRRRSRSRSATRRRDRSRERRRSRSRERKRSKERRRSRSRSKERRKKDMLAPAIVMPIVKEGVSVLEEFNSLDKDAKQQKLDSEMKKFRERIERERAEKKVLRKKEEDLLDSNQSKRPSASTYKPPPGLALIDSDEEEEKTSEKKEATNGNSETQNETTEEKMEQGSDDEIDPLDAFMEGIKKQVRTIARSAPVKAVAAVPSASTTVKGSGRKARGKAGAKGEVMEQNQDGLEYSDEGEEEDLQQAMDTYSSATLGKIKKQTTITFDDITFQPFRKDFYIEVPELAQMTPAEVEALRAEMEGITVKGKNVPKPIKTWPQAGISKRVLDVLKKLNFEKPTPIQCQALPAIMTGRDLIAIAKTGSGKTIAFLLPMFRHIMDQPPLEATDGPIGVVLTPTRELAMQITKDCRKFAKALGLRVVCVYGGTGISEQIAELKRGAEIIICTPGRMIDMLAANSGRVTNMRRCTYVVLDEADRMFDMGFEPQVMRIIDSVRPDRQTVMFSATFPRQMEALARRILIKPIEILVGGRSVVCKEVEQYVLIVSEEDKFLKLLEVLGKYGAQGSAIIFVDKQEHADALLKDLMTASYNCSVLHGGIDQFDRDSTIVDFKNGKFNVLVATSVAARGLDVKQLILVVNYDCPNHYEDYVHRCGRTGRAGNKGFAYTFITPEQERYSVDILRALEASEATIPEDLQKLYNTYKEKMEAEGKKIKGSSGFSGKGFKFDETEANFSSEKKKYQKAILGINDSDEDDAEDAIEQDIETMLAPKKRVVETKAPPTAAAAAAPPPAEAAEPSGSELPADPLEKAKLLASRINKQIANNELKTDEPQAVKTTAPNSIAAQIARSIAEQRAEKLHLKLNYTPSGEPDPLLAGDQTYDKFEEELEINDFPQQARWKVTSKEAIAQIAEYSEAGLTVRGTYYPPGKEVPEGERKLFIAIESHDEMSVKKARTEIVRLIKEELVKLQHSYQPMNRGRYKVL